MIKFQDLKIGKIMEVLLEELYNTDLIVEKFHPRKLFIDEKSYQINGITQSGKTKLLKSYLLTQKKSSYLYIDCKDMRIQATELNKYLKPFCTQNKIDILVLDNYYEAIEFANVSQLLIASELYHPIDYLTPISLYPLDYEEFLAYEHKYDSSALNHFFKLGALPSMHKINQDERTLYIQRSLRATLDDIELDILIYCAKAMAQKVSAYTIYERLKNIRKISKDKLYKSYEALVAKKYIHQLEKINHPKATKKLYLCDISLKAALSTEKNFAKLFENMIFLELLKSKQECYYDDTIDFYIPSKAEVILGMPFTDERTLFKKLESIEAFIFRYQIRKVTAVTMNKEGSISHPFSRVEMLPFDIWALGDS